MPSTHSSFTESNIPTRRFGSDHDPVLDGVTRGLEALFPPVHQHTRQGEDPETVQDDHEA